MNWPNLLPDMYAYLPVRALENTQTLPTGTDAGYCFQRQDVVKAFHASARKAAWAECNGHVSDAFWGQTKPSVHLLPSLLESGLPILLFSGMQDLICNHVGTEKMIENLTWSGATGWGEIEDDIDIQIDQPTGQKDWWVDGEKAGTWQTSRNLTYVQVFNSSHMVCSSIANRASLL
jgi:carboxypeptidase D